ncbi:glycosyltransferase family 4 protein [Nostoc sp.]|uniref:glycosyltransferase family 4 protein n=1 Tax=Nostoc sp. TaxID=1180 RepID=UPI002FFB8260
MKILLTVHQFLPDYSSGTEILTYKTAKELLSRGYDVSVFTGYPAQAEMEESARFDSYIYEDIKIIRFHNSNISLGGQNIVEAEYNNLFLANYFRQYLIDWKPDIVHFFHLGRLSASAIDVCAELQIPTVMTTTDFWLICPTNQLRLADNSLCAGPNFSAVNCLRHLVESSQTPEIKKKVKTLPDWLIVLIILGFKTNILSANWYYGYYVLALTNRPKFMQNRMNKIDRVLVPTRLMQNILKNNGLNPKRISFVPYGLDTKNIQRETKKGHLNQLRVGFIGTLYEHKGVHLLLEAICKYLPDAAIELKIYGNLHDFPEYVNQLHEIAKDDPRISFCGTFPNHEISKVFSDLDVLIVPSIWYENTPLVIYSAQAAGCPVIGSDVGGISEIIQHQIDGLLFERGNASELAKSIRILYEDRTLLNKLAQRLSPPKSIEQYVDDLESTYSDLKNL